MKLPRLASILLVAVVCIGSAAGRFGSKLTGDRQILHILNRLTFGPRPGDIDTVRRMGVEKWIDLQLHPERIPDSAVLEAKLKPLETLRLDPVLIAKNYGQSVIAARLFMANRPVPINTLLSQEETRKVFNGTAEERKSTLDGLAPEKRKQVLLQLPATNLASLPEIAKEAEDLRKAQQVERLAESKRLNPQMQDYLTPEQVMIARRGTPEQLRALFADLDEEKRAQLASQLPMNQALAELPEFRRLGLMRRNPQQLVGSDLKEGKLLRAVYSDRQLEEVLVDFWFNHFNVYENKNVQLGGNAYHGLIAGYERDAIRPHVLGHFRDLVLAVAKHPAMLYYLDNWQSMSEDTQDRMKVGPFAPPVPAFGMQPNRPPQGVPQPPHGLNENFGRELMELHTLGVGGGYTQKDVVEVARCLTGWTVRKADDPTFAYIDFMHDKGEKTVLGHKIAAGGGENDGVQVIDLLARHPSTARFISRQLAQRFVADDPPMALVDRMAAVFLKTDGDLRAVLQSLFASPEFNSEGAWEAKVKSPFEMVVSALRATGADVIDGMAAAQRIADLGEPSYDKIEPNGYPLTGDGWLGTSDLLGRLSFANSLGAGQVPGVHVDSSRWEGKDAPALARELLGRDASPELLEALSKGSPSPRVMAGLVIGSPEFNRR